MSNGWTSIPSDKISDWRLVFGASRTASMWRVHVRSVEPDDYTASISLDGH